MLTQAISNGLIAGCEYGLFAAGISLIYRIRSFFHLAHGAAYLVGAYVANVLAIEARWPMAIAIAAAIFLATMIGAAIELAVYRPLVRRGASVTILLIASLGLLIALQNVVEFAFGSFTRTFYASGAPSALVVAGLRVTSVQLVTVGVYAVVGLLLWGWLYATRSGKIVRAVADSAELGIAFGIDSDRVILTVFAVASALAAIAGILAGYNTNIYPTMGFWAILPAIVAVVAGGLGNISGAFLGGLFVGVVGNLAAWFLPSAWQDAVMFAILLAFLLIRPQGIVGTALPARGGI